MGVGLCPLWWAWQQWLRLGLLGRCSLLTEIGAHCSPLPHRRRCCPRGLLAGRPSSPGIPLHTWWLQAQQVAEAFKVSIQWALHCHRVRLLASVLLGCFLQRDIQEFGSTDRVRGRGSRIIPQGRGHGWQAGSGYPRLPVSLPLPLLLLAGC